MCRFEVFARKHKAGPFWNQLAAGEAASLEEVMHAVRTMVSQRRDWAKLPRSWLKPALQSTGQPALNPD